MNYLYIILFIFLSANLFAQDDAYPAFYISADRLRDDIIFLGSDSCEGRATGTRGSQIAANYLSNQFKQIGLSAFNEYPDYYQNVPMHGVKVLPNTTLQLVKKDSVYELKSGTDFVLYKTNKQLFGTQISELVFAGYGINAPEFDYNDYFSVDVQGKVVVVFSGEPYSESKDFFNSEYPTIHSYSESKFRTAIAHGASGIIIIDNQSYQIQAWNSIRKDFYFEDVTLAYNPMSVLSVRLNEKWNKILFQDASFNIQDVYNWHFSNTIKSFKLKTKIQFTGKVRKRDFLSPNIIGYLPGSEPDKYMIISAHYDHLGIGMPVKGDSIYNGVLDNAMGSAALLEIARNLKTVQSKLKSTVIFLLTTGEEKGLLGSTYYTDHPVVPLYKTVANVNIDGIAFLDNFKSVVGIGSYYSSLGEVLYKTCKKTGIKVTDIPDYFNSWESFNRSDQISFAKAGIPSILIMEGIEPVNMSKQEVIEKFVHYIQDVYHSPFDDLSISLNYGAMQQHTKFLTKYIYDIANSNIKIKWYKDSPYRINRLRSISEKR